MQIRIENKEFQLIKEYIKKVYGINLSNDKKDLVLSRLKNVLIEKGFKNFTQYYDYILADKTGEASIDFIDRMTINHTFFMREVNHFKYLEKVVLPYLENSCKEKDIRLWCAGCSSGEEAYTIQMILTDYFKSKYMWNTEILATDISSTVLRKAVNGVYSKKKLQPLSRRWKKEYFQPYDNNSLQVCKEIRDKIIYRKFNLMQEKFPFKKKFQVIFCRNVMIYFDNETRTNLVKKFYDFSEEGAYLFIGHSETLNNIYTNYKYISPAIYRKI